MKRVLCYGDSNTWGNSAFSRGRIPFDKQWVNILQTKLDNEFVIIQEGLPGRIAGDLQADEAWYNGRDVFRALLISHSPLDVIIISLGTNDFQKRYDRSAEQIASDILWYYDEAKRLSGASSAPKVVILAPVRFHSTPDYFEANDDLYDEVMGLLQSSAQAIFVQDIELTDDDVHFTFAGHERLAKEIEKIISQL